MKLVHKNVLLADGDSDVIKTQYIKAEAVDGGCMLSMFNAGGSGETHLVRTEDFPDESRTPVFWSHSGRGFIFRPDAIRWRDLQNYLAYFDGCTDGAIGTICKVDGELFLIFGLPVFAVGLETIAGEGGESSVATLNKIVPGYIDRPVVKIERAKADLVREINPLDVLSDLEKQIDLLTSLVLLLADSVPKANLPDWLGAFKDMNAANSSLQFSGVQAAIAATVETKSKLRKAQSVYFETRKAANK